MNRFSTFKVIFVAMFIVFALIAVISSTSSNSNKEVVTIKVTDKERVTTGTGSSFSSKYLIYTDNEVFEDTDALLYSKFNSSDIYGKLHKDSTYKVVVVGMRIPVLSMYRNIIEIK